MKDDYGDEAILVLWDAQEKIKVGAQAKNVRKSQLEVYYRSKLNLTFIF